MSKKGFSKIKIRIIDSLDFVLVCDQVVVKVILMLSYLDGEETVRMMSLVAMMDQMTMRREEEDCEFGSPVILSEAVVNLLRLSNVCKSEIGIVRIVRV
mmetsp:Transcript_956/g.998  ORF Transcript_956/g.998 Transcript_956/m.998 type:complete len:99 (+) Transcript_956:1460-1756(+)